MMTYEGLLKRYADHLTLGSYSLMTIKKYSANILEFFHWLSKDKGIVRIQDITRELLTEYQNKIMVQKRIRDALPLGLWMKYGKLVTLKTFFKFLVRKRLLLYNPAGDLDLPRVRKDTLREVLKENEVKKILSASRGDGPLQIRDRALLELFYSTGMRNSEARSLEIEDVDFERQEARIRHGKGYFGKRERVVPIGRIALSHLEDYLTLARPKLLGQEHTAILFVSKSGLPLRIQEPDLIIKKYARIAGIKKKVRTHLLRHSFATHLLRHGADIRYVQAMLGHASLDSTQIYTKVEISDLKRIHRKTHPRERF